MSVKLFNIDREGSERLSTMARPRGDDWLEDEMKDLSRQGVTLLISFLTDEEVNELGLTAEAELAAQAGIKFIQFPVQDRALPSIEGFRNVVRQAADELQANGHVVSHCRNAGIGRGHQFLDHLG